MPTLADIYSAINTAKRKALDFVQNPGTSLQQMVGNANDRARDYNQQMYQAAQGFGAPARGQQATPEQQSAQQSTMDTFAEAYNPAGIFVPAAKEIAFKAAMLEKKGLNPKEIWEKLKVHRGANDKQWRQEVGDSAASLKGGETFHDAVMNQMTKLGKDKTAEPVTVGDVFEHPELFKKYPDLKDIEVRFHPENSKSSGTNALPEEGKGWIQLKGSLNKDEAKDVMLHELQHPIQEAENWAVGGSAVDFQHQDAAKKARDILGWRKEVEATAERMGMTPANNSDWFRNAENKLVQDYYDKGIGSWLPHEEARFQASWPAYSKGTDARTQAEQLMQMYGLDKKTTPYNPNQMYNRLGGEVEARQVQQRQNLTPDERQTYFPGEYKSQTNPYGYDTPISDMLYLNRQGYYKSQDLAK
jgi:hypothetical protein